jgi:sulfotransferase family protein
MARRRAKTPAWPNLFVVGAGKAGTTSLWRYLGAHPEIFMSSLKEPCFFAGSSFPRLTPVVDSRDAYLRLFEGSREAVRGEASPTYLMGERAPVAIREVSPEAKIVISLREPVARTHALYLQMVQGGAERRSFRRAVSDEIIRGIGRFPYVDATKYVEGVERYLDAFGDRVLVLFFEDLVATPRQTIRTVCEFLDVDPGFAGRIDVTAHNPFAVPRGPATARLIGSRRARRAARSVVPRFLQDRIYRALLRPAGKPEPDPETVQMLAETYEPGVLALAKLLGRDFPDAWERRFPTLVPTVGVPG